MIIIIHIKVDYSEINFTLKIERNWHKILNMQGKIENNSVFPCIFHIEMLSLHKKKDKSNLIT